MLGIKAPKLSAVLLKYQSSGLSYDMQDLQSLDEPLLQSLRVTIPLSFSPFP